MKHPVPLLGLVLVFCALLSCDLLDSDSDDDPEGGGDQTGEAAFQWVDIPAGAYTSGDSALAATVAYDYKIMKYEVTNRQFVDFLEDMFASGDAWIYYSGDSIPLYVQGYYEGDEMFDANDMSLIDLHEYNQNPSYDQRIKYANGSFSIVSGYANHPVVQVTWFGAHAFAKHYGLSLPTEAEWEKAARGNMGYKYPWGNNDPWDEHLQIDCDLVNYGDCRFDTAPVGGTTGLSPYGVSEMAGNVFEWCQDFLFEGSYYHTVRGGSWNGDQTTITTYFRYGRQASRSYWDGGFRCVDRN